MAATVSDISSAAVEQASSIDEMSQAVAHMDGMTQQNAAMAEESAAASAHLSQQVCQLQDQVGWFRTGTDGLPHLAQSRASLEKAAEPIANLRRRAAR